jgi:hypothetical protein
MFSGGVDHESKLVLDDGDDLFITESFQPSEENSSVIGNSSVSINPSVMKVAISEQPIEGQDLVAEKRSTPLSRLKAKAPILRKFSFPGKITKVGKEQVSKISKLALFPGTEQVSKVAIDTLDDGEDLLLSDSFLPTEENSSIVGNSSVMEMQHASFMDSKIGNLFEKTESSTTSVTSSGTENDDSNQPTSILQKLSISRKLIIPSKGQVLKLSEDVPFALPGKDPVSKLASDILDDGDDLYISESFQESEDVSSIIGNSSVIKSQQSSPRSNAHQTGKTGKSSPAVPISTSERIQSRLTSPIIRKLPQAAGKITRYIPGKVIRSTQITRDIPGRVMRSSQKLLPSLKLNSLRTRHYRTGMLSQYQEIKDDKISDHGMTQKNHQLGLERQDSNCSEMSDITEPTVFSKSRSFRNSRSMYIEPLEACILEEDGDEFSEGEESSPNKKFFSEVSNTQSTTFATDTKKNELPKITKTKPFTAVSSYDIFAPEIVNNFLDQIQKIEESWDIYSVLSNDEWHLLSTQENENSNSRKRISSDSEVILEFQRERLGRQTHEDPNIPRHIHAPPEKGCTISKRRNNSGTDSVETKIKKSASTEQFELSFNQECISSSLRTRVFSDSEYIMTTKQVGVLPTSSTVLCLNDLENDSLPSRSRLSSDSALICPQEITESKRKTSLNWTFHSKAANTIQKWTKKSLNAEKSPRKTRIPTKKSTSISLQDENKNTSISALQQLTSMTPATALKSARTIAENYTRSQEHYWNLSSESDECNSLSGEVKVWLSDDSFEDIL